MTDTIRHILEHGTAPAERGGLLSTSSVRPFYPSTPVNRATVYPLYPGSCYNLETSQIESNALVHDLEETLQRQLEMLSTDSATLKTASHHFLRINHSEADSPAPRRDLDIPHDATIRKVIGLRLLDLNGVREVYEQHLLELQELMQAVKHEPAGSGRDFYIPSMRRDFSAVQDGPLRAACSSVRATMKTQQSANAKNGGYHKIPAVESL